MKSHSNYIYEKASELAKIGTIRDIVDYLDLRVEYVNFKKQKGVYVILEDFKFIFINNNLDDPLKKIVLLHEIAHDQLHSDFASYFVDANIFSTDTWEYEANLFASHIILPDEKILPLIYEGYSEESIAGMFQTDINLVSIKVFDLTRRGHNLDCLSYDSNFLRTN